MYVAVDYMLRTGYLLRINYIRDWTVGKQKLYPLVVGWLE